MVPELTSSSPATIRSAVVLPQPDGPTSTSSSPSATSRSSALTAVVPSGNCLETASSTIRDMSLLLSAVTSVRETANARPGPQQVTGERLGRALVVGHALPGRGEVQLVQPGPAEARAGGLAARHRIQP